VKIVVFSKMFKDNSIDEMIQIALDYNFDGYDLCIRPGHPVNPDNVTEKLLPTTTKMKQAGLIIPMVTSDIELLSPDDPTAEPILATMDAADIRLIKIGYTFFDPLTQDYWDVIERMRQDNEGWQRLAKKHNVKICYHTHNERVMGINAAALCHLLNGFDPQYMGAYLDPTHLMLEGEEFTFALSMVQRYLALVAGKDVLKYRQEKNDHGTAGYHVVPAGEGMVDWTQYFADLKRVNYEGPLSVHCEWHLEAPEFLDTLRREIQFFKRHRDAAGIKPI